MQMVHATTGKLIRWKDNEGTDKQIRSQCQLAGNAVNTLKQNAAF